MEGVRLSSHTPLAEQVLKILREAIVSLRLYPGQALSESSLATELGASRTPIRHALKFLESEGLVYSLPQRSTYVTRLREKEVWDAAIMRRLLERWALREMRRNKATPNLQVLDDLIESQRKAVESDSFSQFLYWDTEFHKAILDGAGNEKLLQMYDVVNSSIMRVRAWTMLERKGKLHSGLHEHQAMVAAIKDADWRRLSQLILDANQGLLAAVKSMKRAHPEYFEDN